MRQMTDHHARLNRITAIGFVFVLTIVMLTGVAQAATFTVNTTSDAVFDLVCNSSHCSLREAVYSANNSSDLLDFIVVPEGVFTLTRTGTGDDTGITGDLDFTGSTLLLGQGPGITIIDASALGDDRVVHVLDDGNITLRGLTIKRGNIAMCGGGVRNDGRLILDHVDVTSNTGMGGGGVCNVTGADLSIKNGSRISYNFASNGEVEGPGGGIRCLNGSLTVTDSTVSGNTAINGGGLYLTGCDTTITGSTIAGNWSNGDGGDGNGGGLSVSASTVDLINSTITRNGAFVGGGAAYRRCGGEAGR